MDERLTAQSEAWDAIVAETDPWATTGLGAAVTSLATAVDAIAPGVQKVRAAVAQDGGSVEGSVRELQAWCRAPPGRVRS